MRYLYVDDQRTPTPNANFVAKSYNAAIMYLSIMEFDVVDLDYSLNDPNGNGYDLLVYMYEHGIKPGKIVVHSDHSVGRPKMLAFIREHFK